MDLERQLSMELEMRMAHAKELQQEQENYVQRVTEVQERNDTEVHLLKHGLVPCPGCKYSWNRWDYVMEDSSLSQVAETIKELMVVVGRFDEPETSVAHDWEKPTRNDDDWMSCEDVEWIKYVRKPLDERFKMVSVTWYAKLASDDTCKVVETTRTSKSLVCESPSS